MSKNFYITTTLPYVNADLHMGHALEFVRADVIARYKKLVGFDVFFNTGTDEHGMKIFETAKKLGKSEQQFVDESFLYFKKSVEKFGMLTEKDGLHFIRTTDKNHIKSAQEFWKRVDDNGYIYKKNYKSKYCVGCEETKTDSELIDGKCSIHTNRDLEFIEEENYFFKYSEFKDKLLEFYKKNPNFVVPSFRFNEIKNFVQAGLQDFSISRLKSKMPWGIEVPGDSEHVMYVWFDALTNYINTLGWPNDIQNFQKYWVDGTPVQYCGKDNTRFQSSMWQAMLMAAELPNSYQIIVNGFITAEGGVKMSKTLGNVVDPKEIVDEYGVDALRYFLLREISSFEDSPFTKERFKESYNSGLANGLGNLTSRVLTLSERYLEKTPEISEKENFTECFNFLENFEIQKAINYIWDEISKLDQFIQETEPFKVVKNDEKKGKELISNLVLSLYKIVRMLQPFLPETSTKIQDLIQENKKPNAPLFIRK